MNAIVFLNKPIDQVPVWESVIIALTILALLVGVITILRIGSNIKKSIIAADQARLMVRAQNEIVNDSRRACREVLHRQFIDTVIKSINEAIKVSTTEHEKLIEALMNQDIVVDLEANKIVKGESTLINYFILIRRVKCLNSLGFAYQLDQYNASIFEADITKATIEEAFQFRRWLIGEGFNSAEILTLSNPRDFDIHGQAKLYILQTLLYCEKQALARNGLKHIKEWLKEREQSDYSRLNSGVEGKVIRDEIRSYIGSVLWKG